MIEWIKNIFVSRYLGSFVRHLFSLLSGVLLTIGVEPKILEQFEHSGSAVVIAVFMYFIAQASSIKQKKEG